MAYFVAGLVVGVLLTNARRYLTSSWLWVGIALSLLIFAPNLIWQVQHNFISLQFLLNIHARDVAAGRTAGYLAEQFYVATNLFTVPFWAAGLYFYLSKLAGKPYRILGWMYLIPFALFLVTQGRSYYLAPAYPMLVAAGVVVWEQWVASLPITRAHLAHGLAWGGLAAGAVIFIPLMLPFAPINSALWDLTSKVHDNFVEEIGWPDMVKTVADIYTTLPLEEQHGTAILTGNYGEAGAVDLYGPAYGLPQAISGINSYWLRGYGDPPPGTLIVIGFSLERVEEFFTSCDLAGHVTNRYSVENEETRFHPDIFLCRGSRQPWPNLWDLLKSFG